MADFDTSPFDQGDPLAIELLMAFFGVQSINAYKRIIQQLLLPIANWEDEIRQYVVDNALLEFTSLDNVLEIQEWSQYRNNVAMTMLGRLIARYFGHTPPH